MFGLEFGRKNNFRLENANATFLRALSQEAVGRDGNQAESTNGRDRQPRSVFDLFHTFAMSLPKLFKQYEFEQPEKKVELIRHALVRLLNFQLEAFVTEILQTPFSTTPLNVIEFTEDSMRVNDPRYVHADLATQMQNSIDAAEKNGYTGRADRYKLERDQGLAVLALLSKSMPHAVLEALKHLEPQDELPAGWTRKQKGLPKELCAHYTIAADTPFLMGPQAFSVYPQNKEVYKEGLAYWCMYSVVYIPSLPEKDRFHVVLNQYFNNFDYTGHKDALNTIAGSEQLQGQPTESQLMQFIALPTVGFDSLNPALIIAELTKRMGRESAIHPIMVEQQRAIANFQHRAGNIFPSAEYLAQVFLEEFNRYARGQSSPDEIRRVLEMASEVALNPLIRGAIFDKELALGKYYELLNPRTRRLSIQNSQRGAEFDMLRDGFIGSFQGTKMADVLNRAVSVFDCTQGTFGGLTKVSDLTAAFQNSSLSERFSSMNEMMTHFHSSKVTYDDLYAVIGERAKNFKPGICGAELREKGYHVGCGNQTLIGECGLCYGCEIGANFDNVGPTENDKGSTTPKGELAKEIPADEIRHISVNTALFSFIAPTHDQLAAYQ